MADKLSVSQWIDVVVESHGRPGLRSPLGDPLPAFPPVELQRMTTGLDGEATIRQAGAFYADVIDALERDGQHVGPGWRVLDFGCGWGRVARFFLRDVHLANLHGIDVDTDFIELTRRTFSSDKFTVCQPFPPASFPPHTLDLIVAYSVFSHLSETAALEWVGEFARLVRPGGVFAFTTRHESFLDYCAWLGQQKPADSYSAALGALFPDVETARARYRRGELVHATSPGVSGGGPRNTSFYGETFIPQAYVERQYGRWFALCAMSFDPGRYDQACFVLKRNAG
jgi:SAM-dependent methyltransferase